MALLILTGKHEAIQLKTLHGDQILMVDEAATNAPSGDSFLLVALRDKVMQFARLLKSDGFFPLKPGRKQATR